MSCFESSMKAGCILLLASVTIILTTIVLEAEEESSGGYSMTIARDTKGLDRLTLGSERGTDFVPSNVNIEENLSLYTGQFVYALPLFTLTGKNGFQLPFSISYSSAGSGKKARLPNRYYQSSEFGMNWKGGMGYIRREMNSTSNPLDDRYTYVDETGATHELIQVTGTQDDFRTTRHHNWKIHRFSHTGFQVRYWQVTRDDGRRWIYGNNNLPWWSPATRFLLVSGPGSGDPHAASYEYSAYQWDLESIKSASNETEFSMSYNNFEAQLLNGLYDGGDGPYYAYTRSSLIARIDAPDGRSAVFYYEARRDIDPVSAQWQHDFYDDRRLSRIELRDNQSQPFRVIKFQYDYLNRNGDDRVKKLLLTSVQECSPDNTSCLPAWQFEYEMDSSKIAYGCMIRVLEPFGCTKEAHYKSFQCSGSLSDTVCVDPALSTTFWNENTSRAFSYSDKLFALVMKSERRDSVVIGVWNGAWRFYRGPDFNLDGSDSVRVYAGVGNDYAAVSKSLKDSYGTWHDSIIVLRLTDGTLRRTAIVSPLRIKLDDPWCRNRLVSISPQDNYFILAARGSENSCQSTDGYSTAGYAFTFDGSTWNSSLAWRDSSVWNPSTGNSAHVSQDCYAAYRREGDYGGTAHLDFGVIDAGTLIKQSVYVNSDYNRALRFVAASSPYVAYFQPVSYGSKLRVGHLDNHQFIIEDAADSVTSQNISALALSTSFVSWVEENSDHTNTKL